MVSDDDGSSYNNGDDIDDDKIIHFDAPEEATSSPVPVPAPPSTMPTPPCQSKRLRQKHQRPTHGMREALQDGALIVDGVPKCLD